MKKHTKESVISLIDAKYPGCYTYERLIYKTIKDKSIFTCVKHGDIEIAPETLIHRKSGGNGCKYCRNENTRTRCSMDVNVFKEKIKEIHPDTFNENTLTDYSSLHNPCFIWCNHCEKQVTIRPDNIIFKKSKHRGCVSNRKSTTLQIKVEELKRNNSKNMEEWKYSPDWCENDLTDGSYVGFVYLFEFEDGSRYIGSKQMYKGVKNVKSLKGDEKENNWRDYSSSSKIVNQKIADGDNYTRTILWGFASMDDVMLVEMILILNECLKPTCLNLSTMHKCKFPNIQGKKKLYGVVQEILGWLN